MSYISYQHVDKAFGTQVICQDFNLEIDKGERVCIIGPSGAGKTVTIKMLIGLLEPDAGEIHFDGINFASFKRDEDYLPVRKRIAMVFQGAALFDSMTVFDNVAYGLANLNVPENEIKDKVEEKLEWVGLKEALNKMPSELSGGMKKRIGLARAIATDPEVVLYDEPTAGLDPITTVRIVELIMSLQEKLKSTAVMVTHDIPAVLRMSTKVAFLYQGQIRALGPIHELMTHSDPFVRGFLNSDPNLTDIIN
ncbi:MAG: ABC transporter ATP-binding protein [Myxococcaceae bacterium]